MPIIKNDRTYIGAHLTYDSAYHEAERVLADRVRVLTVQCNDSGDITRPYYLIQPEGAACLCCGRPASFDDFDLGLAPEMHTPDAKRRRLETHESRRFTGHAVFDASLDVLQNFIGGHFSKISMGQPRAESEYGRMYANWSSTIIMDDSAADTLARQLIATLARDTPSPKSHALIVRINPTYSLYDEGSSMLKLRFRYHTMTNDDYAAAQQRQEIPDNVNHADRGRTQESERQRVPSGSDPHVEAQPLGAALGAPPVQPESPGAGREAEASQRGADNAGGGDPGTSPPDPA